MNRKLTNKIRFVLDECLPSFIRNSRLFMYPFYYFAYGGRNIKAVMNFKKDYPSWTDQQVKEFYESLNSISRNRKTDLTDESLRMIIEALKGDYKNVLDVGCAKGYVLSEIRKVHPELELTGVDFVAEDIEMGISFVKADIRNLPFEDKSFDVVLCSHTIEHMPDLAAFVKELKRVAKKMLIVVTPKQRYYFYSLDEHLQFFPERELLTAAIDIPQHTCENIDGDWFYKGFL